MLNNLITIVMLLAVLGVLHITNTVLGAVKGSQESKFEWKKIGKGMLKAFLFCLCFISYCFCLEILPVILSRIDITVPSDLITFLEIVGITLTAYKKYALDCYTKIKDIMGINTEESSVDIDSKEREVD